jgi:hypothetical protein
VTLLALYRLATELGGPLFEIALQRRARQAREDPARLAERRGVPSAPRPDAFRKNEHKDGRRKLSSSSSASSTRSSSWNQPRQESRERNAAIGFP